MKNILLALFVLILLHGKGPDIEAPKGAVFLTLAATGLLRHVCH